ncbi:cuticle protein 10.9-like [Stegodyphus dumicola]|uniref:cuticle protein 10.9-like n=1 Tax=Stegodyphus dumicola TaxID=202533 RepID=UPI0015AFFAEC|nr:cuticle protein 10.9-like [Stegodyphus dumicola]
MFKLSLLVVLATVAIAQYGHHGYGGGNGGVQEGGYGGQSDYGHQDYAHHPIPYKYGYDIVGGDHHSDFKQTRQEHGDGHGNVQGSYSYSDGHGNHRQVDYVADHHGFRAVVKTNEPGTENQSPADVQLHAPASHHQQSGGLGLGIGSRLSLGHSLY